MNGSTETPKTSYRTCPLCEATCGLAIEHHNGRVVRIRGDADDVFSKGFICPKGAALGELNSDPDRLQRPMVRRDGQWHEVDWDSAFEAVAAGLGRVIEAGGRGRGGAVHGESGRS